MAFNNSLQGLRSSFRVPGSSLLNEEDLMQPGLGPGSSMSPRNPLLSVDRFNRGMRDELEERAFNVARTGGGPELEALKFLFDRTSQDIAESPLTSQMGEVQGIRERLRGAGEAGFSGGPGLSPIQEQSRYTRSLGEEQLRQPLEMQELQNRGMLERQQEVSRGQLDVAEQQGENVLQRMSGQNELLSLLTGGGGQLPSNLRSVNPSSGAFSFQTPQDVQQVPQALLQTLTGTLRNLVDAEGRGDARLIATERAAYDQALNNVFAQHPAAPELKATVQEILVDFPDLRQSDIMSILTDPRINMEFDLSQLTSEEMSQMDQLLRFAQGGQFSGGQ